VKRYPQPELLDDASLDPEEALISLRDLRTINLLFGGVSTTAALLRRAMRTEKLRRASVLEVASGDGYSIACAAKQLQREGLHVAPLCLDRRGLASGDSGISNIVVGDALRLNFPANSFDFVSCGLFVHHLAPSQVVEFINGALKIANYAVLINDLRRSWVHFALVHAWTPLFRSQVSRVDGAISVRQAYTPKELRDLICQTQAQALEIRRRFLFRMAAIAWKYPVAKLGSLKHIRS